MQGGKPKGVAPKDTDEVLRLRKQLETKQKEYVDKQTEVNSKTSEAQKLQN